MGGAKLAALLLLLTLAAGLSITYSYVIVWDGNVIGVKVSIPQVLVTGTYGEAKVELSAENLRMPIVISRVALIAPNGRELASGYAYVLNTQGDVEEVTLRFPVYLEDYGIKPGEERTVQLKLVVEGFYLHDLSKGFREEFTILAQVASVPSFVEVSINAPILVRQGTRAPVEVVAHNKGPLGLENAVLEVRVNGTLVLSDYIGSIAPGDTVKRVTLVNFEDPGSYEVEAVLRGLTPNGESIARASRTVYCYQVVSASCYYSDGELHVLIQPKPSLPVTILLQVLGTRGWTTVNATTTSSQEVVMKLPPGVEAEHTRLLVEAPGSHRMSWIEVKPTLRIEMPTTTPTATVTTTTPTPTVTPAKPVQAKAYRISLTALTAMVKPEAPISFKVKVEPPGEYEVVLQRYTIAGWAQTAVAKTNAAGEANITVKAPSEPGSYEYRAMITVDGQMYFSAPISVTVSEAPTAPPGPTPIVNTSTLIAIIATAAFAGALVWIRRRRT